MGSTGFRSDSLCTIHRLEYSLYKERSTSLKTVAKHFNEIITIYLFNQRIGRWLFFIWTDSYAHRSSHHLAYAYGLRASFLDDVCQKPPLILEWIQFLYQWFYTLHLILAIHAWRACVPWTFHFLVLSS